MTVSRLALFLAPLAWTIPAATFDEDSVIQDEYVEVYVAQQHPTHEDLAT